MEIKHVTFWQCPVCEEAYEKKEYAHNCCGIKSLTRYRCSICEIDYTYIETAERCLASHLTELKEGE